MKICKSQRSSALEKTPPMNTRVEHSLNTFETRLRPLCWAKYLTCWLIVVQWVSAQSVPWLIDTITQSGPSSTTTPTYLDTATQGNANFRSVRGMPVFGGDLITCGMFYEYRVFDNIRVYTPKGEPVLNFSSNSMGIGYVIMKSVGSNLYVISTSYLSGADPNYYFIQPVAVSGSLMATTGTRISVKTSPRTTVVVDEPGTIYFFGAFTSLLRISSVDGTVNKQSTTEGSGSVYPEFVFRLTVFDAVLVYFGAGQNLVLFGRTNLNKLRSKVPSGGMDDLAVQSRLNEAVIWNINCPDGFNNLLQRRVITNDGTLITTAAQSPLMPFYLGTLSQLGTFQVVMVSPYHTDYWTPYTLTGVIYFVREDTMAITSYATPQNWLIRRMTTDFSNPAGEDGGRRFYLVFSDARTQNLHSYFFLVDTCMSLDGTTLSCTQCPNGYWRASTAFAAPRRCVSPDKFPALTGMSNTTMTFETCTVAQCTSCTYDYTRCTGCDSSGGYYLRQTPTGGVCELKSQFPPGFGVDQTGKSAIQ